MEFGQHCFHRVNLIYYKFMFSIRNKAWVFIVRLGFHQVNYKLHYKFTSIVCVCVCVCVNLINIDSLGPSPQPNYWFSTGYMWLLSTEL
jgi:hypothetical protein